LTHRVRSGISLVSARADTPVTSNQKESNS
jgi:hypothetical protein